MSDERTAAPEWRERAACNHMIGQHMIGGVPGHEHSHPTGPQVCLRCGKTLDELLAAASAEGQKAERERWTHKCIIEVAVDNPSVSHYMSHWEGRALKAESQVAEAQRSQAAEHQVPALRCGRGHCSREPKCPACHDLQRDIREWQTIRLGEAAGQRSQEGATITRQPTVEVSERILRETAEAERDGLRAQLAAKEAELAEALEDAKTARGAQRELIARANEANRLVYIAHDEQEQALRLAREMRQKAKDAIADAERAEAQLAAQQETIRRLSDGIKAVRTLIDDSRGVIGIHRNGDEAPWDELLAGGRFETWLSEFSDAEEAIGVRAEAALKERG